MSEKGSDCRKRKFRKQNYHGGGHASFKKSKRNSLEVGDKGFLVTCGNGNEARTIREAYDLLNEFADILYGVEDKPQKSDAKNDKNSEDDDQDEEDIESALKDECARMKGNGDASNPRRFTSVDCGVKNCLFIKSSLADKPSTLAFEILSDLKKKSVQKCRFLQRLLPVDLTCKTFEKDFMEASKILVDTEFAPTAVENETTERTTPITYAIQFKARHNNNISKEMSHRIIGDMISVTNPKTKVDLTKPEKTILIEILGKISCLSVVREYHELHRYNVHEVVNPSSSEAK